MWIILGSICALIIALYVFQVLKQPSTRLSSKSNRTEPTTMSAMISSAVEDLPGTFSSASRETSHAIFDTSVSKAQNITVVPTATPRPRLKEDDQRLRVFDEL